MLTARKNNKICWKINENSNILLAKTKKIW